MVKRRRNGVDVDEIIQVAEAPHRIRNISIIAHVDHGKSSLADSLLQGAGQLNSAAAGTARKMDTRDDEAEKGVTIKSTGATLLYDVVVPGFVPSAGSLDSGDAAGDSATSPSGAEQETLPFVINVIDSPGHIDFSAEVTASLRLTDGALVVVDAVEGPRVQTRMVMRQALKELVVPVLVINKVDRFILEKEYDPEEAFFKFKEVIGASNAILDDYADAVANAADGAHVLPKAPRFNPRTANVLFASAKQGWGFTLRDFADYYARKLGSTPAKWLKRLWGDFWFDPANGGRFTKKSVGADGSSLERGFCKFVLRPLWEMFELCRRPGVSRDSIQPVLDSMDIQGIKSADYEVLETGNGSAFLDTVMKAWLPAGPALASLIVEHIPSPVDAQPYRVPYLYDGDLDTDAGRAMLSCDPDGPFVMYVSKMVPDKTFSSFFAYGRVFSGRARTGAKVFAIDPESQHAADSAAGASSSSSSAVKTNVTATQIWMASTTESVSCGVPAGSTVGLSGLDGALVKTGTVSTDPTVTGMRPLAFSVAPVMRVSVRPAKPTDLKAFVRGLKRLNRSDPSVVISTDPVTKETIIAGNGKLHLEVCLADLANFYAGVPVVAGEPITTYGETITATCPGPVLKRSANKHNRVFATAAPMVQSLVEAVDSGSVVPGSSDANAFARALVEDHGWDKGDAKAILGWGVPGDAAANVLVNESKGVNYLNETADALTAGFHGTTQAGPLCGEPVRGVRFAFVDGLFHGDSTHRNPRQVEPAAAAAFRGAMLSAEPRLVEPMFTATVTVTASRSGAVYSVLAPRRGIVFDEKQDPMSGESIILAHLPVGESHDLADELRDATSGHALCELAFSHWALIDSDPFEDGSLANRLVMSIRERKGLTGPIPVAEDVIDRQ